VLSFPIFNMEALVGIAHLQYSGRKSNKEQVMHNTTFNFSNHPAYYEAMQSLPFKELIKELRSCCLEDRIGVIHDTDQDGLTAAALFSISLKVMGITEDRIDYHAVSSGRAFQCSDHEDLSSDLAYLVILDQGCSEAKIRQLLTKVKTVIIFDHHAETAEHRNLPVDMENLFVFHDVRWSTTALTYELYSLTTVLYGPSLLTVAAKELACIVNYHDTWKYGASDEHDIIVRAFAVGSMLDRKHLSSWLGFIGGYGQIEINAVIEKGLQAGLIQKAQIDNIVRKGLMHYKVATPEREYTYALAFHSDAMGELGEAILKEHSDTVDFAAIVYQRQGSHPYRISLRSTDKHADVQQLAKHYEGGGHRNAAGIQLTHEAFAKFISQPILN
jgi:oligoribonuclease NrnB/cAMP/cGMP phosphodiesterase (DHH superfamily)